MLRDCLAILSQPLVHLQADLEKTRGETEGWREQFVLGKRRMGLGGGGVAGKEGKPKPGGKVSF